MWLSGEEFAIVLFSGSFKIELRCVVSVSLKVLARFWLCKCLKMHFHWISGVKNFLGVLKQVLILGHEGMHTAGCFGVKWAKTILPYFLYSSSSFVGLKIGNLEYLGLDHILVAVSSASRGIDFHCTHHIAGNSMLIPWAGRRPKRQLQMQYMSADIVSSTWATKGQSSFKQIFHFIKEIHASLVICWDKKYLHIAWGNLSCCFTASAVIVASRAHGRCDSNSMPCTTESTEVLHCFLPLKLF